MRCAVILPAAGASTRYTAAGGERGKLDEDLGGRSVLSRTLEVFASRDDCSAIIVAGPADPEALEDFRTRHRAILSSAGVTVCAGGHEHRWQSVRNALDYVPGGCTHVAVHDAARPCIPPDVLDRVFEAAARHPAVIPAVELSDTIKRVSPESVPAGAADTHPADTSPSAMGRQRAGIGRVQATPDRRGLYLVQTPQVFRVDLLRRAYAQGNLTSTDDAGLVERLGEPVVMVEGDTRNLKITRPADLAIARAIWPTLGGR